MNTIKTVTTSEENAALTFGSIELGCGHHYRAKLDSHGSITLDTGEYIPACDVQLIFCDDGHICID